MTRGRLVFPLVAFALVTSSVACERRNAEGEAGAPDTLAIDVPDEVEDRVQEGARTIGGAVGEALEETGEAIEGAGERIQEEVGEPVAGDTTRM